MKSIKKKSALRIAAAHLYHGLRIPLYERYRILTNRSRATPDFLIIGAQKGGTTSLFRYLEMHPQILPAIVKEPFYFLWNYDRGIEFYRSVFPTKKHTAAVRHAEGVAIVGEASTHYIYYPQAAERIRADFPDAKLIILLRDPVERAFSHWRHRIKGGSEKRTFEDAISDELHLPKDEALARRITPENIAYDWCEDQYLSHGLYIDQIRTWSKHFKEEQLLILISEDFFRQTDNGYLQVLSFLGVRKWKPPGGFPVFNEGINESLSAKTRQTLSQYYAQPNSELEAYLGRSLSWS